MPGRSTARALLRRCQGGFTLIEVVFAMAAIGIVSGVAVPNLIEARKGANESAAIGALRSISTAQNLYHEQDRDGDRTLEYATGLNELAEVAPELVDDVLGSGQKQGYHYGVQAATAFTWAATAEPITPGKTGDRSFYIDETGIILPHWCPEGYRWDFALEECVRDPNWTGGTGDQPIGGLEELNSIAFGLGLDGAKQLSSSLVARVLSAVDADGDGKLTFDEVLSADLVKIAHDLSLDPTRQPDPREAIAGEAMARSLAADMQAWLTQWLELGAGNEVELPAIQMEGLTGDPLSLLARVPEITAQESLMFLRMHLQNLDTRADPAGDGTSSFMIVNQIRRMILVNDADRIIAAHERGLTVVARQELTRMRQRADGDAMTEDWVAGPVATRIVMQIDLTLRLP